MTCGANKKIDSYSGIAFLRRFHLREYFIKFLRQRSLNNAMKG